MNNVATAIQSLGLTGTAAEIRTALNADVELSRNSTPQSLAGVADRLAAQGVDVSILIGLRNHIRTLPVGGDTMEGLLLTGGGTAGGVDFTLPTVRGQIAYNQGHPATTAEQQAILAGLLLIGITPGKRWQKSGLESLPSEAEITAALAEIAERAEQDARYQSCLEFWNRISRDHDLGELTAENYAAAKAELA